jgi:hypothetical protein
LIRNMHLTCILSEVFSCVTLSYTTSDHRRQEKSIFVGSQRAAEHFEVIVQSCDLVALRGQDFDNVKRCEMGKVRLYSSSTFFDH